MELMRVEEAPGSLKNVSFLNENMLQCALVRGGQSNWLWIGKQIKNIVLHMASTYLCELGDMGLPRILHAVAT